MKKRPFSLIEVLVSFSLISLLISSLTGAYFLMQSFNTSQERELQKAMKESFLHQKLLKTFINIQKYPSPEEHKNIGGLFPSELEGGSLVFLFDTGPDPKSHYFSNRVLARLYVDEKKQLILSYWPDPSAFTPEESQSNYRKEILFAGASHLSFDFYRPPVVNSDIIIDLNEGLEGWQKEWNFEDLDLPAMIKIRLKLEGYGNREWVFPVPAARKQIVFRRS